MVKRKRRPQTEYNTKDEIKFLKNMKKSSALSCFNHSRLEKLMLYKKANIKRVNWGKIEPLKVYEFLDELIFAEEIMKEINKRSI